MSTEQTYCVIDYETYSGADLKRVGAHEYAHHPTTEIICAAWRVGTRKTLLAAKTESGIGNRRDLASLIHIITSRPEILLVAHNAFFEYCITAGVLGIDVPPSRWVCTASLAAALALPRHLEGAAQAFKLPVQKDMAGRRLVLKWCKPRKPSKHNPSTRHDDPEELRRLVEYCKTDVDTETHLFLKAPPLTPKERRIWKLDQTINARGFYVDRELVKTTLDLIKEESAFLTVKTRALTGGKVQSTTQRDAVLAWLEGKGTFLPDLQRQTVEDAITQGLVKGDAKEVLACRLAVSKTSTAKYRAFDERSRTDSRLRDILRYHAASTGRWGGNGVQVQNLPRPTIKDTNLAAEVVRTGDLDFIRLCYGEPMQVFSNCIRSVITAPPGRVLDVADYNAIEARVVFWLAKDEDGLAAFREGRKLYEGLAASIFGVPLDCVTPDQRWLGKTATLGCIYRLGAKQFRIACANNGRDISAELAETAVRAFREAHKPVVTLWSNIERAAIWAVENVGKSCAINHTKWFMKGGFLYCELPSGRRLAYPEPSVKHRLAPWGENRLTLHHWGVDGYTKKWVEQHTHGGPLVENVTSAIARDVMAEAMLRIEDTGRWQIVFSVHDELVAERVPGGGQDNGEFCRLMEELPEWAEGLPIKVEGFESARYRK